MAAVAQPARMLVIGESLVDVVETPDGLLRLPGGSPLNVAVGLARLEVPTLLATELGADDNGRLVADHLAASGVQLAPGAVRAGVRTSTATVGMDEAGNATYTFDLTWDPDLPTLPRDVAALHVGSLGTVLEPGRRAVLEVLETSAADEVLVSYDPNLRPGFLPTWQEVRTVAARADLVKLSEDDLRALHGEDPDVEELARELLAADRTELVVVTHGGSGASAFTAGDAVDVPAPGASVVDTVGAGDSFTAALLAVLDGWDLVGSERGALDALDRDRLALLLSGAARAAATTVGRRGANPPTRGELPPTWPAD
jgi:fructokinase